MAIGKERPRVSIDRLSLRLEGASQHYGSELAQLVSQGLADADLSGLRPGRMDSLKVDVDADPRDSADRVARQIVASVLRQIERSQ